MVMNTARGRPTVMKVQVNRATRHRLRGTGGQVYGHRRPAAPDRAGRDPWIFADTHDATRFRADVYLSHLC